jgi:tetratricopeptide (TPR) repeat protein
LVQVGNNADRRRIDGEQADASANELATELKYYQTMFKVVQLALKIDPESTTIRSQAAVVDEYLGNFASAHQRLTKLIDALRAHNDRDDRYELIDLIVRRSRVAISWAAELRGRGDAVNTGRALELDEQAAKALSECERDVADLAFRPDKLQRAILSVYHFYWIASETWLALGDLARDQGRFEQARLAFRSAKHAFDRLSAFGADQSITRPPAEFEALRKRVKEGVLASGRPAAG